MSRPLRGLRVLDCSRGLAGVRATGILADYGADVIWVEPPGGDPFRTELAVAYSVFNRGKRSVLAALPGQRDRILELAARADVFVESFGPGVARRLGVGPEDLRPAHPALVTCSISGFGADADGAPAGYESIVHAAVGSMGIQVGLREGPIYLGLPFASIGASQLAVIGILSALLRRAEDGHGRHIETSLVDGILAYLGISQADEAQESAVIRPGTKRLVARTFECADGEYIGVHTGAVGGFGRFIEALGLGDRLEATESGLDMGVPLTAEQQLVLAEDIPALFLTKPRDYWLDVLDRADVATTPVLAPTDVFDEPQVRHNRLITRIDDPGLGPVDQVGPTLRFDGLHPEPARPAPTPGQDTAAVLGGADPWTEPAWSVPPRSGAGPDDTALLAGLRVLDLGAYHAGPYASRLLADLGADVVKLEPPAGDPVRGNPRPFRSASAKKRSIAVNLKAAEGKEILDRALRWARVVHHNMRPGAAERLGFAAADVAGLNPDAVYAYSPGWGSTGPWAMRQSFEPLVSDYVGVSYEVAGEFNPPLFPCSHGDPGGGMLSAVGILLALLHQRRSGRPMTVESPQLNSTLSHLAHVVRREDGEVLGRSGLDVLQRGIDPLDRLYPTADGWLAIAARRDDEIRNLGGVLGIDLPGAGAFATPTGRTEHRYELESLVESALAGATAAEWQGKLTAAGVPAVVPEPGLTQLLRDPAARRRGQVAELTHERWGTVREVDTLIRVAGTRPVPHRLAPALGEHTDEVLAELGYHADEVAGLRAAAVVR